MANANRSSVSKALISTAPPLINSVNPKDHPVRLIALDELELCCLNCLDQAWAASSGSIATPAKRSCRSQRLRRTSLQAN